MSENLAAAPDLLASDADELERLPLVASLVADRSRDRVLLWLQTAPGLLPRASLCIAFEDCLGYVIDFDRRRALAQNLVRRLNRCADRLLPRTR